MSARRPIRAALATSLVKAWLGAVIVPGRDPLPVAGTKLADREGRAWIVEGYGVRRLGPGEYRWWAWSSPEAGQLGPMFPGKTPGGAR